MKKWFAEIEIPFFAGLALVAFLSASIFVIPTPLIMALFGSSSSWKTICFAVGLGCATRAGYLTVREGLYPSEPQPLGEPVEPNQKEKAHEGPLE